VLLLCLRTISVAPKNVANDYMPFHEMWTVPDYIGDTTNWSWFRGKEPVIVGHYDFVVEEGRIHHIP
jgi:hypothetical protein